MSLEDTNQISEPLIQSLKMEDKQLIEPKEQKMQDNSCCESCCECFGKMMDCCLPCGLICILLER